MCSAPWFPGLGRQFDIARLREDVERLTGFEEGFETGEDAGPSLADPGCHPTARFQVVMRDRQLHHPVEGNDVESHPAILRGIVGLRRVGPTDDETPGGVCSTTSPTSSTVRFASLRTCSHLH